MYPSSRFIVRKKNKPTGKAGAQPVDGMGSVAAKKLLTESNNSSSKPSLFDLELLISANVVTTADIETSGVTVDGDRDYFVKDHEAGLFDHLGRTNEMNF